VTCDLRVTTGPSFSDRARSVAAIRCHKHCPSDHQSRVVRLTTSGCAGLRPPGGNRLVREPDREASALAQAGVILGPICDPVPLLGDTVTASGIGFERHGRYPTGRAQASYVTQCQLPTRLSVQQSKEAVYFRSELFRMVWPAF
jgi:hypothetical protein